MKQLPPELIDWYFPFNWDVELLWKLNGEAKEKKIANLEWHLDKPLWSSVVGQGMLFDLKPIDVLANPKRHAYHWNRIEQADTRNPICMTEYKGRDIIIDGIHRLAKFVCKEVELIDVKFINESTIQEIATYA